MNNRNKPQGQKRDYYNRGKIEAIDAIESACSGLQGYEGFLTGTCLKYLFRWRWKGTAVADLRKAQYYLDRLIAEEEKKLGGDGGGHEVIIKDIGDDEE